MRKTMCCLFCFFLMLSCAIAFGQEKIKIGYFYLEPFTIAKEGATDPIGVSVDYWEELIAPKMGVKIEWVGPLPITRMYHNLDTGEVDAIFICVKNPEREKKYLFSTRPYAQAHAGLWVLKKNPLDKITKVDDLFNWKIGFVAGSKINPFLENDKITIENVYGEEYKKMNFEKLLAKRLDAVYDHNEYTLAYEAGKLKIIDKVKFVFLPLDPTNFSIAFAKTERAEKFLKLYEPVNNSVVATDAVKKIIKKYTGK